MYKAIVRTSATRYPGSKVCRFEFSKQVWLKRHTCVGAVITYGMDTMPLQGRIEYLQDVREDHAWELLCKHFEWQFFKSDEEVIAFFEKHGFTCVAYHNGDSWLIDKLFEPKPWEEVPSE